MCTVINDNAYFFTELLLYAMVNSVVTKTSITVFKYLSKNCSIYQYLNTQILMLVFKYHLRVFKYLTTAYNNHPVKKKYALSLIIVHILGLVDLAELS